MGAIYDLVPPVKTASLGTGKWNAVEIRCEGPEISVKLPLQYAGQLSEGHSVGLHVPPEHLRIYPSATARRPRRSPFLPFPVRQP